MSAQAKPNNATQHAPGRGRIYDSITETIGDSVRDFAATTAIHLLRRTVTDPEA